jgi:hypothetical protein
VNDGRAPDTSKLLLKSETRKKVTTQGLRTTSIKSLNLPCIPWNTCDKSLPQQFEQTCRVDSFLQCFVYLISNNLFLKPLVEIETEGSLLSLAFNEVDIGNFDGARNLVWVMFLRQSCGTEEVNIHKTRDEPTVNWNGQATSLFVENRGGGGGIIAKSCKWIFKNGSIDCSNDNCPFRDKIKQKAGRTSNKWTICVDTLDTITTSLDNQFGERFDVPCPFVTSEPNMLTERQLLYDEVTMIDSKQKDL